MYTNEDLKEKIDRDGLRESLLEICPDEIENEELSKIWDNLFIYSNLLIDFFEKCGII